jgi:hypothetical protein
MAKKPADNTFANLLFHTCVANFDYCYLDNHMHYNNCLMEMIWLQRNFMITYDDTTMYLLSHQCVSIKFAHWALDHFVSMSMKD